MLYTRHLFYYIWQVSVTMCALCFTADHKPSCCFFRPSSITDFKFDKYVPRDGPDMTLTKFSKRDAWPLNFWAQMLTAPIWLKVWTSNLTRMFPVQSRQQPYKTLKMGEWSGSHDTQNFTWWIYALSERLLVLYLTVAVKSESCFDLVLKTSETTAVHLVKTIIHFYYFKVF